MGEGNPDMGSSVIFEKTELPRSFVLLSSVEESVQPSMICFSSKIRLFAFKGGSKLL